MLTHRNLISDLQSKLQTLKEQVVTCEVCGNIGVENPCHICSDEKRDRSTICVVEGVDDLWAMERSGAYKGLYHVLGGVVSAIDGIGPEDIAISSLVERMDSDVNEVILALGASLDGQTTSHLIARRLKSYEDVKVTTLARGLPMGAEVDYMDDGTLLVALNGRLDF